MMEDLSLHILDIAENAVAAGASKVSISINENEGRDLLSIRIMDNGRGMSKEVRKRALDPFFTTKNKKTGLGLPFLAQAAGLAGGRMIVESAPGRGTRIIACFRFSHIDRQPLRKMAETMMTLVLGHPEIDFRYRHRRNGREFRFRSRRFIAEGGAGSPTDPQLILAVRKDLREGLKQIGQL